MIYFIRHGQSTANAGGMTMEHARIPLSDLGRAQAAMLAQLLEVDPVLVLTSSYLRARETAKPFCDKTGCVATPHPLLHEFSALDPALIDGMSGAERRPIADAYWQEADPAARHGPGSETFVEFDERETAFLGELPSLPGDTAAFRARHLVRAALLEAARIQGRGLGRDEGLSEVSEGTADAKLRRLYGRAAVAGQVARAGGGGHYAQNRKSELRRRISQISMKC